MSCFFKVNDLKCIIKYPLILLILGKNFPINMVSSFLKPYERS